MIGAWLKRRHAGPGSLQRRLGLGLTLGLTLLWLAATLTAGLVVRHEMDEAFDSALQETSERLLPLAVMEIINREEAEELRLPQHIAPLDKPQEYLTYLVRDAQGRILLQSHDVDPSVFPPRPQAGFHTTSSHRFYGASAVSGTVYIEVAEPLGHRREALGEAVIALLLPLAIAIPLSLVGVWLYVRHSLRSVVSYRDAIAARGEGDLTPVQSGPLPAEIDPIAEEVNQLLDRLRRALEAERSFTANSAHELRTPLAEALAQLQRLRREVPEGSGQDRIERIESSLRGLARLSEKLMQLAKAEGAGLIGAQAQDMVPVLRHVLEDFRAGEGRLVLDLPDSEPVLSTMDPDAFAILLRNLIENALKHGPEDEDVEVRLASDGLRVINGGPAVSPDVLNSLTDRFVRGSTRASGAGLGLAIVQAIARGAGSQLVLKSPASGRSDGFEASVRLPQ
ncbi:HAMP domain-containing sensor histidine kinase [Marinobacteraceae bacterium S3BR75-40.1]